MTNSTINIDIDTLTEDFKAHCKVIKLGYEYTGFEKYAIVTDLSYAQIMDAMRLLRSTIARFYFSAKLLARSSQILSATRTSFLSGCRKMTATALRMA